MITTHTPTLRLVIIPRHHAEWLGMLPASLGGWVHTGAEWYNGADSLTSALGRNGNLAALPASLAVDDCERPADALALAAGLERDADTCAKIRYAGILEWAAPMRAFARRLRASVSEGSGERSRSIIQMKYTKQEAGNV